MKKNRRYLVFTRFKAKITKEMYFIHVIWNIENNENAFYEFIKQQCENSKEDKSYLNIYELTDYEPNIFKVAYIDKGKLYTL